MWSYIFNINLFFNYIINSKFYNNNKLYIGFIPWEKFSISLSFLWFLFSFCLLCIINKKQRVRFLQNFIKVQATSRGLKRTLQEIIEGYAITQAKKIWKQLKLRTVIYKQQVHFNYVGIIYHSSSLRSNRFDRRIVATAVYGNGY